MHAIGAIARMLKDAKGSVVIGDPIPGVPVLAYRVQGIKQVFQQSRPDLKVLGQSDTKADPQQNFDAWNNLVKAHPDAVAYLGVGDQDNVALARIKRANHGTYLSGAFHLTQPALPSVTAATHFGVV